jgi:hypothetical protein
MTLLRYKSGSQVPERKPGTGLELLDVRKVVLHPIMRGELRHEGAIAEVRKEHGLEAPRAPKRNATGCREYALQGRSRGALSARNRPDLADEWPANRSLKNPITVAD